MAEDNEQLLGWAITSLKQEDPERAAGYYAKYADGLVFSDRRKAAFFYMLAANYARIETEDWRSFAKKRDKMLELLGDTVTIGDVWMESGARHLKEGATDVARHCFRQSIINFAEAIGVILKEGDDADLVIDICEKMQFCAARFRE